MPFALIGLALTFTVMLLFGGMELDRGLLFAFYVGDKPGLACAARLVTELGGWRVLIPLSVAGAAVLLWRRDWRNALLLLAVTLSGRLAVALFKDWAARVRPDANDHLVAVQSYSFPSGHAANAALVWLALALLLPRTERGRAWAVWGAVWLVLAIGASRVMLGVHWPSDVIAGWAFGLFWTLVLLRLSEAVSGGGTAAPAPHSSPQRREIMADRTRPDDSALIDEMEGGASQSGVSGGNMARDVASRAEQEHEVGSAGGEGDSVTRVHGSDKPDKGDRPNLPNRD